MMRVPRRKEVVGSRMRHERTARHRRIIHHSELVPITCWCEEEIVHVTTDDVWNGITESCGRTNCRPLENVT